MGKPRQAGEKGLRIAETVEWCSAGGQRPQRRLGPWARGLGLWTEKIGG